MDIFLDTNILYNNWFFTNANFQYLLHFINNDGHTLLICDVVKKEIENKHREELEKSISNLKNTIDELRKLTGHIEKIDESKLNINYSLLDILDRHDVYYKSLSCDIVPQSIVVERAIKSIRPFQDNEKGYRDTLIWLTLINYADSDKSKDDIIFICDNKNDFFDTTNKSSISFHPDLNNDIKSLASGKRIIPFLGVSAFIETQVDKNKHAIVHNKLEQFIDRDIELESEEYLENLSSKQCIEYLSEIGIVLNNVHILDIHANVMEGIEDPEVLSSNEIDNNKVYIQYYYNLRIVILSLTISFSDYLTNKGNIDRKFINIEHDNDQVTFDALIRPYFDVSFVFDRESETMEGFSVNYLQVSS